MDFFDPLRLLITVGIAEVAFVSAAFAASLSLRKVLLPLEGLGVVYEDENPEIDIVCVHGLGGDPVETWTSRRGQQKVNWTKDLLPKNIKDPQGHRRHIRVLTYGYSLRLFGGSQKGRYQQPINERLMAYLPQALYLHSNRLIQQLADLTADHAEKRPVIFVAHSFGGLIVKSALVHASAAIGERDARLKAIELLTVGVLFFGTPQRDSRGRKWSDLLGNMLCTTMPASLGRVIQPLADQAEILNLQIERYKSIESHFPNFSFYEGAKSQIGRAKSAWIVQKDEAVPKETKSNTWKKILRRRTHKDLAKFDSDQDIDFATVVSCINGCLELKNCQSALNRHDMFFDHLNTPRGLTEALSNAQQNARLKWEELESNLSRVISTDSKEEIDEKQKINKGVLDQSEKDNGLSDLTTLTIVSKMASDALEVRRYQTAEALYKRLFVSIQETYTPCDEEVAAVLRDVAQVAVHRGQLVEATKTFRRVREIRLKLGLEEDDLRILEITEQVISLCVSRGLYDDALQEVDKIVGPLERKLGTADSKVLQFREIEAKIWREKGRKDRRAFVIAESKTREVAREQKAKDPLRPKKSHGKEHSEVSRS